jgi:hypothetical protein
MDTDDASMFLFTIVIILLLMGCQHSAPGTKELAYDRVCNYRDQGRCVSTHCQARLVKRGTTVLSDKTLDTWVTEDKYCETNIFIK